MILVPTLSTLSPITLNDIVLFIPVPFLTITEAAAVPGSFVKSLRGAGFGLGFRFWGFRVWRFTGVRIQGLGFCYKKWQSVRPLYYTLLVFCLKLSAYTP